MYMNMNVNGVVGYMVGNWEWLVRFIGFLLVCYAFTIFIIAIVIVIGCKMIMNYY